MSDLAAQIDALAHLTKNWDTYDAPPISALSIANAKAIAALIMSGPPVAGPLPTGNVVLLWRGRDGQKFWLEINGDAEEKCSGFLQTPWAGE